MTDFLNFFTCSNFNDIKKKKIMIQQRAKFSYTLWKSVSKEKRVKKVIL